MAAVSSFSVSVIVPHYNRPDFVRDAVLSVHGQSVTPAEIIVVDDCSQPDAFARLERLSHMAQIVRTPKNVGLAGARNFGAQLAKSDWLMFLDDDDCYLPNKIELQARYLAEHPGCSALGGGLTMRRPDGHEAYWGGRTTRKLTLADALQYTASMAQALAIRREEFFRLGGFDASLRYLEDYELGIRLLAGGLEMHFLAEPVFVYHHGGREQLSAQLGPMLRAELRILHRHRKLCQQALGRLGYVRALARCLRTQGLRRGRVLGRSMWLLGSVSDAVLGKAYES